MFETEADQGGSFVSFLLQQLAVIFGSVVWAFTAELPSWMSQFGAIGRVFEALTIIVLGGVPAFVAGYTMRRRAPTLAYSGRWIWFLPSAVVVAILTFSLFHSGLQDDLLELFSPPPIGEAWWAVLLVTYPTLGCCGYSLGMAFPRERWR